MVLEIRRNGLEAGPIEPEARRGGFWVGERAYSAPEPSISIHSLSARRAAIITWHKQHPHSYLLFKKADRALARSHGKLRAYNETAQRLEKRIASTLPERQKLLLMASLAHVSSLVETAGHLISAQAKERNALEQRISDWRETLPLLDEQIAQARRQPRIR
ncbi:MAG: hypothetical protein WC263_03355 [Candidatus Micrarchaeia archaeon]|jgi:hypothetical protein